MKKENIFAGKVAIVTGAASGIGKAVAAALGRLGATVYAADINEPGVKETAALLTREGGDGRAVKVDVTKPAEIKKVIAGTAKKHGRLDYMFNNAGIAIVGETRDLTDDHWKRIIDINLTGVLEGTLSAYRIMVKQGSGHIVNTASLAGLIPVPLESCYSLTKYAVVGLSTSLRGEGAALGVKVSVVCPGFVRTPILDNYIPVGFNPADLDSTQPKKMTDVNKAAQIILTGVAKNKSIILVGSDAHIAWRLYRIWPSLVEFFGRESMKDLRKIRKEK
jgi:NAD(P)-dependent dehydrogenase (short-subunit alcohol dehydrogenase family)